MAGNDVREPTWIDLQKQLVHMEAKISLHLAGVDDVERLKRVGLPEGPHARQELVLSDRYSPRRSLGLRARSAGRGFNTRSRRR